MSDNSRFTANANSTIPDGETYASEDIGGVKHALGKIEFGAHGSATAVDDASGKRLPVKVGDPLPAGTNVVGGVTVADGADATQGTATDAAVTTDVAGTVSAKLRGLVKVFADIWDSANHWFQVKVMNTVAVTGTFWQATQPVSAASLPLPSGASTAAKQPALGTAGSASADVLSVQGIASMTALKVDGSAVTQPVSAASLPLPSGAAQDSTLTGGSQKTKIVDSGGTNVATVSAGGAVKVDGSAVTQPVSAASLPLPTGAAQDSTLTGGSLKAQVTTQIGAANIAANQGTVGNSSAQLVASRATRRTITIVNLGTVDVYLGTGTVTTGNGILLLGVKGAAITINTTAAINAICGSSQAVSWLEEYD